FVGIVRLGSLPSFGRDSPSKEGAMMKALPHAFLLLVGLFSCSLAEAAGVNFSWDACASDGGVQNKTFACNTNSSTKTMVGSFVLAADQPHFTGVEILVDFTARADSLPAWWQFYNAGACRSSALTVTFLTDSGTNCADLWSGQATGGIAGYYTSSTPN